jgi:hypothetical protein
MTPLPPFEFGYFSRHKYKDLVLPQPRELTVVQEDRDYIIIDDGINNRIAIRKPISNRWKTRHNTEGQLISIQLMCNGVC